MKNNKNIDRLFQEKFKDFEATPNEKIWKNIASSLQEKEKKKRIIPFWWKLSGVAALLAVGFFIGNEYIGNDHLQIPSVQTKRSQSIKNEIVTKTTLSNDVTTNENSAIAGSEKMKTHQEISEKKQDFASEKQKLANENKVQNSNNKAIATSVSVSNSINSKKQKIVTVANRDNENIVGSKNVTSYQSSHMGYDDKKGRNYLAKKEPILNNKNNVADNIAQEKANQSLEKNTANTIVTTDSKVKNSSEKEIKSTEKDVLNSEKITNSEIIATFSETKKEETKTNELEAVLAQKEKDKKKKNPSEINRWLITSTIAPIFFGSTSNDSPVDAKLNSNSKTYENSMSYGVGLQYNLTKKLAIRAGINKLDLDYATNDVAFLENTQNVESLVAISTENNIEFVGEGLNSFDGFTLASNTVNKGTLRQEFGYYEIPFELSYAVIDKKIKVNVITGLSTLFLDKNNVSLKSQKYDVAMGEANNVNKVNFSGNLGLGINYNLYKSFYLNLDSILKYQLNTFNANSGDFNPYTIGLYSGISYKF